MKDGEHLDIIWIIAGVVYVIYKLQKEEKMFNPKALLKAALFLGFAVLPQLVVTRIWGELAGAIVRLVTFSLPLLIMAIYAIGFSFIDTYTTNTTESVGFLLTKNKYTLDALKRKFQECECGYDNISEKALENLLNNPRSPLNRNDQPRIMVSQCYKWMCQEAEWEINRLKWNDLGERLGVSLDKIPLDKTTTIREAVYKQRVLAKYYILNKEGLIYREGLRYLEPKEYSTFFFDFIDEYTGKHSDETPPN